MQTDFLANMFSTEDFLSQGDHTSLELDFSDQCFVDQDFADLEEILNFSEKTDLIGAPNDNHLTDMNLDLKQLLSGMLPDEPVVDISLLNDMEPPPMPVNELSYNLSTTLGVDSLGMCAALSETSALSPHSEGEDYEVCGSPRVSSSTTSMEESGKKYLEMRRKNNIASQRSRKVRKQKNSEMCERLKELERENKELSLLAEGLEKEKNTLQELLMSIISKRS